MGTKRMHPVAKKTLASLAALTLSLALAPTVALADQTINQNSFEWDGNQDGTWVANGNVSLDEQRVVVNGNVTLKLTDGCRLTAAKGITVNSGNSLTIEGGGTLVANATGVTGSINDAWSFGLPGIGAGSNNGAGTITIKSGTVEATGGTGKSGDNPYCGAAGIGGIGAGYNLSDNTGGTIVIEGGTVTATGGGSQDSCTTGGAGIGGGCGNSANVTITGGTVNATGGTGAAGIGKGANATTSYSGSVTLGWSDKTKDSITATYSADDTISFVEGKFFQQEGANPREALDDTDLKGFGEATTIVPLESLKVTFDSNKGSAVEAQDVTPGATATKPADPTLDGHVFKGWYDNSELSGDPFDFGGAITQDTTLYAKWAKQCTVTFQSNGGSAVASQTVEEGESATKPADPTRDGYSFKGWYADKDLKTAFDFGGAIKQDTTLYAKWTKVPKPSDITVTFMPNGGEGEMDPQVMAKKTATALSANEFTKDEYVFMGWNTKPDGSGTSYDDGAKASFSKNTKLYAQWQKELMVTLVTYKGAPTITVSNLTKIANELVTDSELARAVKIRLKVKALAEGDVPSGDKRVALGLASKKGAKAGAWFDLSLFKQVGKKDEVAIHHIDTPLGFTVTVPDSLKNTKADTIRTFYLIGVDGDDAELLSSTTNTRVSGETDHFSTFLIGYKDTPKSKKAEKATRTKSASSTSSDSSLAKTGDDSAATPMVAVLAGMGAAAVAFGVWRRMRQDR